MHSKNDCQRIESDDDKPILLYGNLPVFFLTVFFVVFFYLISSSKSFISIGSDLAFYLNLIHFFLTSIRRDLYSCFNNHLTKCMHKLLQFKNAARNVTPGSCNLKYLKHSNLM